MQWRAIAKHGIVSQAAVGGQNTVVMEHWGLDELVSTSHGLPLCSVCVFYRENDRRALHSRKITSKQKQERAEVREGFLEVEQGSGKEIKNFWFLENMRLLTLPQSGKSYDCPHLFRETEALWLRTLR